MSRAYDAKKHALAAYPDDREAGVSLFMGFIGISEDDFEYEFDETPENYIYGDNETGAKQ
jgi:hypothetical protein